MNDNILKTEMVDWKQLKMFQPSDLKKMSKTQLEKLKESFRKNGFKSPFYVWQDKADLWCLDGNTRLPIFKMLEDEGEIIPQMLPANFINCKDRKEAKKAVLIYNSHYADIQQDILADFIADLNLEDLIKEIDISGIDFDSLFPPEETAEDDKIPDDIKNITKRGDIYELTTGGNVHRVMCGDSTDINDVEKLMDGQKADMVFTDPPYGVDYSGGLQFKNNEVIKDSRKKLKNDDSDTIYEKIIPIFASICKGPIYTWFAGTKASKMYNSIENCGEIHSLIVWVKNGGYGALNANYKQKHEPCLYWKSKNGKLNFCGQTTETTVWEIKKDGINKLHPTQKPVELAEKAILNHSIGSVFDAFLGSGSTLIACEKTNRTCYGMELDEHYCDVIVRRFYDWTFANGKTPVIKRNGKDFDISKEPELISEIGQ